MQIKCAAGIKGRRTDQNHTRPGILNLRHHRSAARGTSGCNVKVAVDHIDEGRVNDSTCRAAIPHRDWGARKCVSGGVKPINISVRASEKHISEAVHDGAGHLDPYADAKSAAPETRPIGIKTRPG